MYKFNVSFMVCFNLLYLGMLLLKAPIIENTPQLFPVIWLIRPCYMSKMGHVVPSNGVVLTVFTKRVHKNAPLLSYSQPRK